MAGFISLADAKAQLRVDTSDEDVLIGNLVQAASDRVERMTGLVAKTRQIHKSIWPGETGHDNATGLSRSVAWGVDAPNSNTAPLLPDFMRSQLG